MKQFAKNLIALSFVLVIVVGGVCNVQAFDKDHGFAADAKLIVSLNLTAKEKAALEAAASTYGPAVKSAREALDAVKEQLHTDLTATSPNGTTLVDDAAALAKAKSQLQAARAQLDSALNASITPAHLQQLEKDLTTEFQDRLDAKTDRILFGYALYLKVSKQ